MIGNFPAVLNLNLLLSNLTGSPRSLVPCPLTAMSHDTSHGLFSSPTKGTTTALGQALGNLLDGNHGLESG